MNSPVYVTQPSLAPLEEYIKYLQSIWESGIMTHNGPLVQQLEKELRKYLGVKHVVCVSSGTCALQLAIRALELTGEIITTPFTFIASANIIKWERCNPVFVDIDSHTWNLDSNMIEEKITKDTSAILPVHVFSSPCDIQQINEVALKHGIKVIYDAAHAMCVNFGGKSILSYGDISCVSFHATKLFNTAEGGACVTDDDELAEKLRQMRFFGFDGRKEIVNIGMNAKMTEVHAGLGLANLKWLDVVKKNRREKYELYKNFLSHLSFVDLQRYNAEEYNYSYMPVLFESQEIMTRAVDILAANNVFPRRYFYPSLNSVSVFTPQMKLSISEEVANAILCLPLYDSLKNYDIERICGYIQSL